MGLFGKKDPTHQFDAYGFTVTEVLFDPPRFSFLPSVYCDGGARRWAVKFPGAEPAFFDYKDVLACEVVENGNPHDAAEITNREFARQIVGNPQKAARINAAKHNMCLGMGVVVAVRTGEGETSKLEIPVFTGEMKRDSKAYETLRSAAQKIKEKFEAMGELAAS